MGMLSSLKGQVGRSAAEKDALGSAQVRILPLVRMVVERFEHASLDAKADREALIKALVEALT